MPKLQSLMTPEEILRHIDDEIAHHMDSIRIALTSKDYVQAAMLNNRVIILNELREKIFGEKLW